MKELIEQLLAVVAEEAEHCERLLAILRRQQHEIVTGRTEALSETVGEQEQSIRRARILEQRRLQILDRLSVLPEFGGERPDMERLISTLSNDYGRRLRQMRESLSGSIDRLTRTKEQNTMLIERSLGNIGETMRLLATMPGAEGSTVSGASVALPVSVDRMG